MAARGKRPSTRPYQRALPDAAAIAFLSPLIFASRTMMLATLTPARAQMALAEMAREKITAFNLSMGFSAIEAGGAAAKFAAGIATGKTPDPQRAARRIAAAGLKPIAGQVKKNAGRRRAPRG